MRRRFPRENRPPKNPELHHFDDDTITSAANKYGKETEEQRLETEVATEKKVIRNIVSLLNKNNKMDEEEGDEGVTISPRRIEELSRKNAKPTTKKNQELHDAVRREKRKMIRTNETLRKKHREQAKQRYELKRIREKREIQLKLQKFAR